MKLTKLKGIAHDLAHHLAFEIWFGELKKSPREVDVNVLEQKDYLSKLCVDFFKERLPKSFDFNKVNKINLKIDRSMTTLKIVIKVKVDNKEFSYSCTSMMQ